jgi:hypothetical protein
MSLIFDLADDDLSFSFGFSEVFLPDIFSLVSLDLHLLGILFVIQYL